MAFAISAVPFAVFELASAFDAVSVAAKMSVLGESLQESPRF